MILVAREALERIGIGDAVFTLGHVGFALGLLAGIEARAEALEAMRRRDRGAIRRLLGPERASEWLELMRLAGGLEVLE